MRPYLISIVTGAALLVLVLEMSFRLCEKLYRVDFRSPVVSKFNSVLMPAGLITPDPKLGHRLTPGASGWAWSDQFEVFYRVNSSGLRGEELKPQRDKKRVLLLGDSFTFGHGIAEGDRFGDVLAKQNSDWNVTNAGVPGWGLDQMLIYLVKSGLSGKPNRVLLFLNRVETERYHTNLIEVGFNTDRVIFRKPRSEWMKGLFPADPFRRSFLAIGLIHYINRPVTIHESQQTIETRTSTILREMHRRTDETGGSFAIANIDPHFNPGFIAGLGIECHDLGEFLRSENRSYPITIPGDGLFNAMTNRALGLELSRRFSPSPHPNRKAVKHRVSRR